MRFLVLPQNELAKFCLKPVSETQYISSSCTLCCMLSKLYASLTIKCIKNVLWPTNRKFIYYSKWFHAVLYIALENYVPLPRFPETFSMWYRIVFGTKLHRFHYCCNLWWVQPLYCINTLDYMLQLVGNHATSCKLFICDNDNHCQHLRSYDISTPGLGKVLVTPVLK